MVTAAHITGSYSKGTLAVESTSIIGRNLFARTNRFIDGKWIASDSKRIPFGSAAQPGGPPALIPLPGDWGPLTNDIHFSIALTNPVIVPGQPATVHCHVQNSSTKIIVLHCELEPPMGTSLFLTNSSGAVRNLTPVPYDLPDLTEFSVLPGQVCDWNLPLPIEADTPPGDYQLKAKRRMFLFEGGTNVTACEFDANSLALKVAR
jgi:hypothetical protein